MSVFSARHSRCFRRMLAVPVLALVAASAFSAPPADPGGPLLKPGWRTVFVDGFSGAAGSLPAAETWIYDRGHSYPGGPVNWGTGEVQEYTARPENVSLDGAGNLAITPRRDDAGKWTSARIETRRKDFRPRPGGALRIEARIQMPDVSGRQALGYWPAFWALGGPYRGDYWNWPRIGEFDVMENVNGIDRVWGVLHCGESPGGPCEETNGLANSRPCPGQPCQAGMHTYRFEWDDGARELRWYVDGERYHMVREADVGAEAWASMTQHEGYFLLLNVAMGGGFPDGVAGRATPVAETEPGHPMLVDYVVVAAR